MAKKILPSAYAAANLFSTVVRNCYSSTKLVRRNAAQQTSDWLIGQLPNGVVFANNSHRSPNMRGLRPGDSRDFGVEKAWCRLVRLVRSTLVLAEPRPDTANSQR